MSEEISTESRPVNMDYIQRAPFTNNEDLRPCERRNSPSDEAVDLFSNLLKGNRSNQSDSSESKSKLTGSPGSNLPELTISDDPRPRNQSLDAQAKFVTPGTNDKPGEAALKELQRSAQCNTSEGTMSNSPGVANSETSLKQDISKTQFDYPEQIENNKPSRTQENEAPAKVDRKNGSTSASDKDSASEPATNVGKVDGAPNLVPVRETTKDTQTRNIDATGTPAVSTEERKEADRFTPLKISELEKLLSAELSSSPRIAADSASHQNLSDANRTTSPFTLLALDSLKDLIGKDYASEALARFDRAKLNLADATEGYATEGALNRGVAGRIRPVEKIDIPSAMRVKSDINAWEKISTREQKALAHRMRDLADTLLDRDAANLKVERTRHGFLVKRDESGRVTCLEKPEKNLRLHFSYEGKSNTVSAMVMENTRTRECRTYVALQSENTGGKRDWISLDSKGRAGFLSGELSVGREGGHDLRLKRKDLSRDVIEPARALPKTTELLNQRDQLAKVAGRVIDDPAKREQYVRNMDRFIVAAKERGLSEKETANFFKESAKLLGSNNSRFLSKENRIRVANEAIKEAIEPTSIRQGSFKTCNVTATEVCMATRNPSKVMKAITEASLTGKFTTADRVKIELPRSTFNPNTRNRTLSSQIFQDLAINTFWKTSPIGPDRKAHALGSLVYDHEGGKPSKEYDGTQRLMSVDKTTGKKTILSTSPELRSVFYPEIYRKIAGSRPETFSLLFGTTPSDIGGVKTISSADKLHSTLTDLSKKSDGFPVTIRVHTSNPPFWTDSGKREPGPGVKFTPTDKMPGEWHVVTIHGYNPNTKKVAVDNTWDAASDHLGKGKGQPIPINELFKAMRTDAKRLTAIGYDPNLHKPKFSVPKPLVW